jgi:Zn-dependent peptidase ImmA (M78 family)
MSAPVFTNPNDLLTELGITEPEELEIEVIAQHCEATVVYKPLKGCAARSTGNADRAIITIDSQARRERQRFSAAHELGHWMFDRGQVSHLSCEEAVFIQQWSIFNPETRANRYASDLLLPVSMFKPRAGTYRVMDFNTVKALCAIFGTSLTATAIRLVEHGPLPSMLVCSLGNTIVWFVRGGDTKRLWPQSPSRDTYAYDILHDGTEEGSGDVQADAWFDHPIADRYTVHEHSLRGFAGHVLSLLWWKRETMLIAVDEYEDRKDARRSDSWRGRDE